MATVDTLRETVELLSKTHRWHAVTLGQAVRTTMMPSAGEPDSMAQRALDALLEGARSESTALTMEGTLGEGGMGVVRLGTQHALSRKVAIKTLREGTGDDRARLKLLREAWVTASLEHPNILPIYDLRLGAQGEPMVVLKRIEGVTWEALMGNPEQLAELLGAGDPLEHNLRILMQVCNALALAHSRGVIHRDIKPENVMIGRFGEVYLVDWGLALSLREDPSGRLPVVSSAVEAAGTPAYMAPEMLGNLNPGAGQAAEVALSERTDIYLLGAVLHEIATGSPPHTGNTLIQVVSSVLVSKPKLSADVPPELAAIIRQCVRPNPRERPASAEAIRLKLADYLRHRGSARLVGGAEQRHVELSHHLASGPFDNAHRQRAYNLFGAARFGYLAAIEAWTANDTAQARLLALIGEMIDHQLSHGDPGAAAALLADLEAPPSQLVERVSAAVKEREQQEARRAQLEHQLDPRVGQRTRRFVAAVMALLWTIAPLIAAVRNDLSKSLFWLAWGAPVASLLVGGALFVWARESLTGSSFNRRFVAALGALLVAQLLLSAGLEIIQIPILMRLPLYLYTWMLGGLFGAVLIERRVAWSTLGHVVAFVVAAYRPQWFFYCAAAANFFFALVLAWFWRGTSLPAAAPPEAG